MDTTLDFYPAAFPAPSETATANIANEPTTITLLSFTDKLLFTISQSGRLNHWVHVPLLQNSLDSASGMPTTTNSGEGGQDDLLPMAHLTATTVLGGTKREDEVMGQTLATTLASAVLVKRPQESRMLVLGLGLVEAGRMKRSDFDEMIGLCLDVL